MVESASELRTVASTVVPSGTRIKGAGIWGGPPSSERAGTSTNGPLSASGYQRAGAATRWIVSTPSWSVPAGCLLSFATAVGGVSSKRRTMRPDANPPTGAILSAARSNENRGVRTTIRCSGCGDPNVGNSHKKCQTEHVLGGDLLSLNQIQVQRRNTQI